MGIIDDICEVKDGTHDSPKPIDVGNPLITSVHLNPWSVSLESAYFISAKDYRKICERSLVETGDILMSMIGTIGIVNYVLYEKVDFAVKNMAIFKTSQNSEYVEYVLFYLKSNEMKQYIAESTSGSTQGYVTLNTLRCMQIIIPDEYIIKEYHCITKELISHIWNLTKEDLKLTELQSLLLAKMGQ
jgi:type I restriction enzyme S subunit